ncbi:hypothetical protein GGI02_006141 [Coemansia sp. RSA 2322]|nr:hypothetical protein GGI02_006141 [Coemansia sp. RSA 2322]
MPIPNYAYSASTRTASSLADTEMDVDMGLSGTPNQSATSPQQYNKWLSEDLKLHIRAVVRNPGAVSALTAQPPVATGLNLSIEEMVHVNLIVSLAQRQAEIIHGIRAIREYEESTSA